MDRSYMGNSLKATLQSPRNAIPEEKPGFLIFVPFYGLLQLLIPRTSLKKREKLLTDENCSHEHQRAFHRIPFHLKNGLWLVVEKKFLHVSKSLSTFYSSAKTVCSIIFNIPSPSFSCTIETHVL